MMDDSELDDLLDEWELAISNSISVEEFLASVEPRIGQDLRKRFLAQVEALRRVDLRMEHIMKNPLSGPTDDEASEVGPSNDGRLEPNPVADALKAVAPAADVEIVPGYRLVSRLGVGGFGEVWEAVGPGDIPVALKLVHCDRKTRDKERGALDIMKNVRHANLLAIFGVWETEDSLIIATELADKTLADRLEEAQIQGHAGIPAAELHEYMREAAKGIDELNRPKDGHRNGIQHRDIKPQNLLLTSGSVKVGDFGLARAITNDATGHTGSMTLAYAAPEFIQGKTLPASDQYSLAITYCQLRGGRLPFSGSPADFYAGHLSGTPDLSMLPESERAAVAKALSKDPAHRWASCREFVAAVIDTDGDPTRTENPPTVGPIERVSKLFEQLRPYRFQIGLLMLAALLMLSFIAYALNRDPGEPVVPPVPVPSPAKPGEDGSSTPPLEKPDPSTNPASEDSPSVLGNAVERAKAAWESSWDWVKTKMK
jgi:serine/threonine protein kinase